MEVTTVQVELPDSLRSFVDARIQGGEFADASSYLQDLVRRDRDAQLARLRELIQAGLDSGPAREMNPSEWAELRNRALSPVK